jgi:hypothetical protein
MRGGGSRCGWWCALAVLIKNLFVSGSGVNLGRGKVTVRTEAGCLPMPGRVNQAKSNLVRWKIAYCAGTAQGK